MKERILVVEDDYDIQELLQNFLEADGYEIESARDGIEAIDFFHKKQFDLILLDIMLPKIDGYAVCELIRKESAVPIVLVTALDDEEDQIRGLDLQADDYVTKPFSMPILLRKISAILRRTKERKENKKLIYEELVLDLDRYQVIQDGNNIEFTKKEFILLKELVLNQGRVLTRQILLENLWGFEYFGEDRVVDTHIKNIRKKLNRDYIKTIRGVGYCIEKKNKR